MDTSTTSANFSGFETIPGFTPYTPAILPTSAPAVASSFGSPYANISGPAPSYMMSTPKSASAATPMVASASTLATPNFNLYSQPSVIIDEGNIKTKLKHPKLTEQIRLPSDSCLKSYNGLYYNFILPYAGDYGHNFQLQSCYILKGCKDSQMQVDSLSNYIENVTLTINNNTTILSRLDGFNRVDLVSPQYFSTNDRLSLKLDFLNLPLLTKCIDDSNYQIAIKFTQPPPMKFELVYDLLLTTDKSYYQALKKEEFTVVYQTNSIHKKKVMLNFRMGRLSVKSA